MFEDIQDKLDQSQKRWKEIDDIVAEINERLDSFANTSTDQTNLLTTKLLLLLVEQLKPMSHFDSEKISQSFKDLLGIRDEDD